ncbi:MAG: efflux RND transporter periplasmic adaptor subunit [Deltaproteobacteria bacterium]|nr:MAG: efflux RND transporter periplasmic adaptor subunit [Deltaproteobacteria bacterium]
MDPRGARHPPRRGSDLVRAPVGPAAAGGRRRGPGAAAAGPGGDRAGAAAGPAHLPRRSGHGDRREDHHRAAAGRRPAGFGELRGALTRDAAQLRTARLALARNLELLREKLVSQQDVDNQEALVGQFEGAVRIDQAQIDSARLNLDYARITSPIDGVTGVRLVDPGNLVRGTDASGIVVITQLDPVAVLFTLPQDYLPQVGQQMELGTLTVEALSRDGNTKLGSGELLVIDNQINQNTATMRLKATFANPQRTLWPNQFVKARLLLTVRKGAIVVPTTAVQRGPEGTFAYVVGPEQTVQPRAVEVEMTQGDVAAIARGLSPGEVVVADGAAALRPGAKVAPRPAAPRPAQPSGRAIGAER